MNKGLKAALLVFFALLLAGEVAFLAKTKLAPQNEPTSAPTAAPTEEATEAPTQAPTEEPTEAPTEEPSEAPTEAPTEPEAAYYNPLTGYTAEGPHTGRMMVVSINNDKKAMPQEGISQADIYYEMLIEGSATRCLAVFSDVSSVEKLGPIRSARIYTVGLARTYDAILAHAGGSTESDREVQKLEWDDIDGVRGSGANAYYRDADRKKAGYAVEHTMFTSGQLLLENATERELPLIREEPYDFGLRFAADDTGEAGEACSTLTIRFGKNKLDKITTMTFDAGTGLYNAAQYDKEWIDGLTGETLTYENVMVLYAKTYVQKDGVHKTIELVGEGTGLFANGGKLIPIKWSHDSWDAPFIYTMEDGSPLTLGVGRTYIALVPLDAQVVYE